LTILERDFLFRFGNAKELNSSVDYLGCGARAAGLLQNLEYRLKESDEFWTFMFHGMNLSFWLSFGESIQ
jgi:hypothetical protein